MKKRVAILLGLVSVFCLAVVAFPDIPAMKPSRLAKSLPSGFDGWIGRQQEPGEREKQILAGDTEFERMAYSDREGYKPSIQVSVVFSGKNLSQSIHRPEVCLQAQGWTFVSQKYFSFSGVLPGGEEFPVKEMICKRPLMMKNNEGEIEPQLLENGEKAYLWRVFYYTFFGHEKIVSGHYERTREDIKDRLFKGYDQRWAYATFSSSITERHRQQGIQRIIQEDLVETMNEEQTKEHIKGFLKQLLPKVVSPPGEGSDPSLEEGKEFGS